MAKEKKQKRTSKESEIKMSYNSGNPLKKILKSSNKTIIKVGS